MRPLRLRQRQVNTLKDILLVQFSILVPSLEVPEAVEETYRAEETIEDDPNLEVIISYEELNDQKIWFCYRLIFPG